MNRDEFHARIAEVADSKRKFRRRAKKGNFDLSKRRDDGTRHTKTSLLERTARRRKINKAAKAARKLNRRRT